MTTFSIRWAAIAGLVLLTASCGCGGMAPATLADRLQASPSPGASAAPAGPSASPSQP
jgi:hypothetical protein